MGETIVEVVYNPGKLWRWCTTKENSVEVVYNPGKHCGGGVQSRKTWRRWGTIQENMEEVGYNPGKHCGGGVQFMKMFITKAA